MRILFVSFMGGGSWGGSEELWSQTALRLRSAGHEISASVYSQPQVVPPVQELKRHGITVQERNRGRPALFDRVRYRVAGAIAPDAELLQLSAFIRRTRPDFICASNGVGIDMLAGLEVINASGIPWCNVSQCGIEWFWPTDEQSARAEPLFSGTAHWFFVSEENRRLFETQWGTDLAAAEIVHNPYKVSHDADPSWPDESSGLKLACVARLDPVCKGQDILLQVLARPKWRERDVTLGLFGAGDRGNSIRRLIDKLALADRVTLHGHVGSIQNIWETHHALVMPSRHEGLPLALVEAALCGRAAIVTDVGGNRSLVRDGETGFLASAPVEPELDAAMERAWNQRGRLRMLGQNARKLAGAIIPADPVGIFAEKLIGLASADR